MIQLAMKQNNLIANQQSAFIKELESLDDKKIELLKQIAQSKGIDSQAIQEGIQMIKSLKK